MSAAKPLPTLAHLYNGRTCAQLAAGFGLAPPPPTVTWHPARILPPELPAEIEQGQLGDGMRAPATDDDPGVLGQARQVEQAGESQQGGGPVGPGRLLGLA
ncbi:hypothetical protein ACFC8N_34620 [Streptomyces sp. NPDC055966]|uniref:hypothetical protein n=1 Tax=Streptomyces sp. NPDC055966 TaxID=3345669 RepID=UPI0035E31EB9